jgi:hypothetical protein
MTGPPPNPTVLNTTVLSNFAHVNHVELLLDLPRLVTVDAVQEEPEAGAKTHLYIEHALAVLGEDIPVNTPSGTSTTSEDDFDACLLSPSIEQICLLATVRYYAFPLKEHCNPRADRVMRHNKLPCAKGVVLLQPIIQGLLSNRCKVAVFHTVSLDRSPCPAISTPIS